MGFLSGVGKFLGGAVKTASNFLSGNAPSLISAGANILGGLISSKSTANTNKAQIDLANQQNQWNLEQWNRQNEYNTPSAQRQRLEDAGLNPLHYGLDGTGNADSLQSSNMPQLQNPGLPIQAALANIGNIVADTELKQAQANNLNAGAGLTQEQAETERQMRDGKIQGQNWVVEGLKFDVEHIKPAELDKINADKDLVNASISKLSFDKIVSLRELDQKEFELALAQQHLDNETKKLANDFYLGLRHIQLNEKIASEYTIPLGKAEIKLKTSQTDSVNQQNVYRSLDHSQQFESNELNLKGQRVSTYIYLNDAPGLRKVERFTQIANMLHAIATIASPLSSAFAPTPVHNTYRTVDTNIYD